MIKSWKSIATRLRPNQWPVMTWAILVLVLGSIGATVLVGVELYSITEKPPQFNTR